MLELAALPQSTDQHLLLNSLRDTLERTQIVATDLELLERREYQHAVCAAQETQYPNNGINSMAAYFVNYIHVDYREQQWVVPLTSSGPTAYRYDLRTNQIYFKRALPRGSFARPTHRE